MEEKNTELQEKEKKAPVKGVKRAITFCVLAIIAVAAGFIIVDALKYQSTDDAYVETTTVSVAPKVSGQIVKTYITDNQKVKEGDLIAEIDPVFLAKISRIKFRIVHAHCPFTSGLAAMRIARLQKIPLVATFHSKYRDDFARILPEPAVKAMLKLVVGFYERADMVWVPQESVVDVIREYGYKGKVEVMDNGSDLVADYPDKYFADARNRLGIRPEEFVMLFVGQHIWEKNPKLVIEALALLPDIPFRMYFIGNGYAAQEMKSLVSERGLDSKVTFVGTITDREKLKDYYAASDLFLFPSLYDNAPLVVREAAALHTPAVMAKGSTASQIITDGADGFLVDNDPEKMAELLRKLVADPARVHRTGIQASKSIVRSWEDCVDEVIDRYNSLLRSWGLDPIDRIETLKQ